MKKLLLLVAVALLPVFGFSQSDLVRWSSLDMTPVISNDHISTTNTAMTSAGITHQVNNYGTDTFFQSSNWPSSSTQSSTKYIQFKIAPKAGFQINLSQFNFAARTQGGNGQKFRVQYSKDVNFASGVSTLRAETVSPNSYTEYTNSFPANTVVLSNEIMYVRLYVYNTYDNFHIQYIGGTSTGPVFTGSVVSNTLLAVNDNVVVSRNTSTALTVLANDFPGTTGTISGITAVTQPTNGIGSVSINPNNTIQFVPTNNQTGTGTFTYTITGSGGGTSTATVTVKVAFPAIAEWDLHTNGNVTYQHASVSGTGISNAGTTISYSTSGMALANYDGSYQHYRYFDIRIKPIAGQTIDVSQLVFDQERIVSGGLSGPTNYSIRYRVVTALPTDDGYDFFNNSTLLIDESIVTNPVKEIPLTVSLNDTQTLIVRFYAKGANNSNFLGWRIKANTLKLRGVASTPCAPPTNDNSFGNNIWNGYVYTYTGNNTDFNTATYIGTVKEDPIFERNVGAGAVNGKTGSRNIPCVTPPVDKFMVRYKMKLTISDPGMYNFTITGDDGYRLYVDDLVTPLINRWNDNKVTSANLKNMTAGTHDLILEYYEGAGNSELTFTYGKIAGDNTNLPYGVNEWKVYGFSTANTANGSANFTLNANSYAGYYTQSTFAPNSELIWNENNAPSTTISPNVWNGAPTHKDNFTLSYRRQGFKCGRYQLKMDKWDDDVAVYIDGSATPVWFFNGWSGGATDAQKVVTTITLSTNSKVEIRLKDTGSAGSVAMSLTEVPIVFTGNNAVAVTNTSMKTDSNIALTNNLEVCSCTVASGTTLTIPAGKTLTVIEDISVLGTGKIVVENNGALVQVNDAATYTGAATSFTAKRNAQPMYRYDFTYWSSPVEGFKLKDVSPTTMFDKFYSWNATTQAWVIHKSNLPDAQLEIMGAGKGYIVRAPQSYSVNPTERSILESAFVGKPNNGIKQVAVVNGSASKWNLVGNPYASAIDVNAFMAANSGVIEGAVYLWTHNSAIVPNSNGSQVYTYSASDYVTVNASGKVAAAPADNSLDVDSGDDFKIASGQSFFVQGKVSGATGTQLVFNNAMRVKQGGQNGQFFRPAPSEPAENWQTTGKHRVWLNLTGGTNAFNQVMVGYIENATNGLDWSYDADTFSGGTVSLYSLLDEKKLTIQGRALPFNDQDQVPLGYKTTLTGTLKIAIDHFDGLFQGQDVYLEDKVLNIVHNLKDSEYSFTTVPGTFNERFVLRYVPAAELGIDNPTVDANSIVVFRNGSQIDIKSRDLSIEHVTVYDLLGKVLFDKNKLNTQAFSTSQINASNQVVIVKVITDNQAEVVKKVIMN